MAEPTYRPNGEAIAKLMEAKGFSTAYDFSRAIQEAVSDRSIQAMIRGKQRHKKSTFEILAQALGVPLDDITVKDNENESGFLPTPIDLASDANQLIQYEIRYFEIHIKISIPYAQFDAEKALWLERFAAAIVAQYEIRFKHAAAGSTIVTLEITQEDIDRLVKAFLAGQLVLYKVISLTLETSAKAMILGQLKEYRETDTDGDRTHPDVEESDFGLREAIAVPVRLIGKEGAEWKSLYPIFFSREKVSLNLAEPSQSGDYLEFDVRLPNGSARILLAIVLDVTFNDDAIKFVESKDTLVDPEDADDILALPKMIPVPNEDPNPTWDLKCLLATPLNDSEADFLI